MSTQEHFNGLSARVSALETDMQNLTKSVDNIGLMVQSLGAKIDKSSSTNWSTLGTWAAVIIGAIATIGSLSINPIRVKLDDLNSQFEHHEKLGGHPEARVYTEALKERLDKIEVWQKMNNTKNPILLAKLEEQLKGLSFELKGIRDKQDQRTGPVWAESARQDAKIDGLEKQLGRMYELLKTHLEISHIGKHK